MNRMYLEMPCGCLISEDAGGGWIPCDTHHPWYPGKETPTEDLPEDFNEMAHEKWHKQFGDSEVEE